MRSVDTLLALPLHSAHLTSPSQPEQSAASLPSPADILPSDSGGFSAISLEVVKIELYRIYCIYQNVEIELEDSLISFGRDRPSRILILDFEFMKYRDDLVVPIYSLQITQHHHAPFHKKENKNK